MTRRSFDDDEWWSTEDRKTIQVHEQAEKQFSGLYDAGGRPLFKQPASVRMGFDLSRRSTSMGRKKPKGGKKK